MIGSQISRLAQRCPVVVNLIAINVVLLFASQVLLHTRGINLTELLGLYYPASKHFAFYQVFTHMFMHGGLEHLFFNMFALWMFGAVLESYWGSRRFLFYYLFTGLGAAALHTFVIYLEVMHMEALARDLMANFTPDTFSTFVIDHFRDYYDQVFAQGLSAWIQDPTNHDLAWHCKALVDELTHIQYNIPTVGASGAVFGLLLAFGALFPNQIVQLLIPPIPLKAKWFVIIYGALELALGIYQPGSSVAHFAHVGGMLFGYVLILIWKRRGTLHW